MAWEVSLSGVFSASLGVRSMLAGTRSGYFSLPLLLDELLSLFAAGRVMLVLTALQ